MVFPLPPVPGFNYGVDPPKGGWTKKYVRDALHAPQDPRLVDDLFDQAANLVTTRNLTNDAYKSVPNPVNAKTRDRAAAGQQLLTHFGNRIQIQQNSGFAARMCKGVVTYMGGSGKRLDASALPNTPMPSTAAVNVTPSSAQSQPAFTPPTPSPQPRVPTTPTPDRCTTSFFPVQNTLTPILPPAVNRDLPRSLGDFVLHCSSFRLSKETPTLRLRVRQIWSDLPPDTVEPTDLTIDPLVKKLQDRHLLSDYASQFLTYQVQGRPVSILADEDLHNAVWEARSMHLGELHIQVTSAEDHGPYLASEDELDRDMVSRIIDFSQGPQMKLTHRTSSRKGGTNGSRRDSRFSSPIDDTLSIDQSSPTKRRKTSKNASQRSYHDEDLSEQTPSDAKDPEPPIHDVIPPETLQTSINPRSSELLIDITNFDASEEDSSPDEDDAASDNDRDYDERFRETMDSQICEHKGDGYWEKASDLVGIVRSKSTNTSQWQMPGMTKPLFHWQWLAVFVCATMNSGTNDLFGALLADEMGLGKTAEAVGLGVFRLLLWRRWEAIKADWADTPSTPAHCAQGAPDDSLCPSRNTPNQWFATCPCEPLSPLHRNRPIEGPSFFIVPFNNLSDWNRHITTFVDLKMLGIEYAMQHGKHSMSAELRQRLRTTGVSLPTKGKPLEAGLHYGLPQKDSSSIWILTTWQTWHIFSKSHYQKTREYTRTVKREKKTTLEPYTELHAAFWVVDESHFVKNINKGPWKFSETMKAQQPDCRPWTLAMSGTMISAFPTDIIGSVSVMSSDSWKKPDHPLHHLRPDGLIAAQKAMTKHVNNPTKDTKNEADQAVNIFRLQVANMLMRRHDGSRWEGERLISLPALHSCRAFCPFPAQYRVAYDNMTKTWSAANIELLKEKQATWDQNKHDDKYLKDHPDRPESLRAESVFNLSRLLRLCANLPYLTILVPTIDKEIQRWTNEAVLRKCEDKATGRIKQGCILDQYYAKLVQHCPKLAAIAKILTSPKHLGAAVLIMSSFPEFLLVLERYLREVLGRRTRMYHGQAEKRAAAVSAFMLMKDVNGALLDDDQPDTLIGLASTMGTGTNLQRATVVILCEPVYDPKIKAQVPKRAHRQGNSCEVWYYILTSKTVIENLVETKEARKAGFTAEAFEVTASEWLKQNAAAGVRGDGAVIDGSTADAAIEVEDLDVEENAI